jgi:hypothetical protein
MNFTHFLIAWSAWEPIRHYCRELSSLTICPRVNYEILQSDTAIFKLTELLFSISQKSNKYILSYS